MVKLTCTATKCVYNNSGLCSASKIKVIGEYTHYGATTHCYTFNNHEGNNVTNSSNINSLQQSDSQAQSVICTAEDCYHNKNNRCFAHDIMVSGGGAYNMIGTVCESFEKVQ